MSDIILETEDIGVIYQQSVVALENVSLSVRFWDPADVVKLHYLK